ncbi:MAG: hypothetical protein IAE98_08915 [Candidatus Kapabacteria bacterium]|nr:hypothetical protein [Candidatus Kapabacteria bacterium]
MELSDAIVVAAIILSVGAVIVATTLIVKKKTFAIIVFILFVIGLGASILFKDDLSKFFDTTGTTEYSQTEKSKNIRFNDLDPDKVFLKDVIFNWGNPNVFTQDSSFLIYGKVDYSFGFGVDIKASDYEKMNNGTYEIKNIQAFIPDMLNQKFFGAFLKNRKMEFLGNHKEGDYLNWNLKDVIGHFGEPEKIWISEDYLIRIYQMGDGWFFMSNDKVYAYGVSPNKNFNPNELIPFTEGKRFSIEK